jgi:hypothetical protein
VFEVKSSSHVNPKRIKNSKQNYRVEYTLRQTSAYGQQSYMQRELFVLISFLKLQLVQSACTNYQTKIFQNQLHKSFVKMTARKQLHNRLAVLARIKKRKKSCDAWVPKRIFSKPCWSDIIC